MKRLISAVLFFVVLAGSLFCSSVKAFDRVDANKKVDAVFTAYKNFLRPDFERLVSDEFVPNKFDFLRKVEESSFTYNVIDISFSVDAVVNDGNTFSVECTWNKKMVLRNTGQETMPEGKSSFVFVLESGEYKLINIKGDNPF